MGGKEERVFLVGILYTLPITCTDESVAVRDGAVKAAKQPAYLLIFKVMPVQLFLMK